ncbi:hypothetical protein [Burkholderia gladioli]|uniref:hypothetical protein n=1 Tax=Burkholderia gladioli TaxID=28095 RepID=UPI000CFF7653|nr:hypothetical protein [Burkholderia gladioli]MDN7805420.1 hypothetical protein [Burkholderia gladioli]PRH01606.1 hypothetical protein C6V08_14330 [Burkholderia gladioli]PRH32971.1 hypothetical protein C6V07_24375 [Burkholderia gladioli]
MDFFETLAAGSRAMGYVAHQTPGVEDVRAIPRPPVASGVIDLERELDLSAASPGLLNLLGITSVKPDDSNLGDGVHASAVKVISNESVRIDPRAAIASRSVCVAAGSRLIVAKERPAPDFGTAPAFYKDIGIVRRVLPASFGLVADGAQAAVSPLPIRDAQLDFADAPSHAFSTTISRAQDRAVGGGRDLEAALLSSILIGLSNAADNALITAIVAAVPANFSFGAAAAADLRFADLRAIVGTGGVGAAVRQDGVLAVQGVAAELTSETASTLVGAFGTSAVWIDPRISLHVKRTNVDGSIQITVFANIVPLLPDSAAFFTVNA